MTVFSPPPRLFKSAVELNIRTTLHDSRDNIYPENVVNIKSRSSGVLRCTNSSLKCANTCKDTGCCETYLPVPKISNNSADDGSILLSPE
jgi:hypothetical protein